MIYPYSSSRSAQPLSDVQQDVYLCSVELQRPYFLLFRFCVKLTLIKMHKIIIATVLILLSWLPKTNAFNLGATSNPITLRSPIVREYERENAPIPPLPSYFGYNLQMENANT